MDNQLRVQACILALIAFFLVPAFLPSGQIALILFPVLVYLVPVGFFALRGEKSATQDLGAVSPMLWIPIALLGASIWLWNAEWIAPLLYRTSEAEAWQSTVALRDRPLWMLALAFVILPSVCEELFHRGIVLPLLASRAPAALAIAISGLIFAATHLSWSRLPPTLALGMILAFLTLRSRSVLPAIIVHGCHNLALLLYAGQSVYAPNWLIATSALTTAAALGWIGYGWRGQKM